MVAEAASATAEAASMVVVVAVVTMMARSGRVGAAAWPPRRPLRWPQALVSGISGGRIPPCF